MTGEGELERRLPILILNCSYLSQAEMQAFKSYIFLENLVMIKISEGVIFLLDGLEKMTNIKGDTSYL